MSAILETIFKRRSIRKYQDTPVPKAMLTDLLKAAMAAPTACNNQPWEFVVSTEKEIMNAFRSQMTNGGYNAPAAITVLYNEQIGRNTRCNRFWEQDLSAAVQNILIAAAGMGLGTVWLGTHPKEDTISKVQKILNVPKSVIPLAVIYVGYPAEFPEPRTQYDETRVHWENY
ncbi:MAG: nitroreductase family protein [Anaerolineaceae bacterium]|nr:nitroreductase family protein [Anaerolineaceae bacterium]